MARDSFPGYTEEYNAAEKHAEDVMTREIGMPGPFHPNNNRELSPWAESVLNSYSPEWWPCVSCPSVHPVVPRESQFEIYHVVRMTHSMSF